MIYEVSYYVNTDTTLHKKWFGNRRDAEKYYKKVLNDDSGHIEGASTILNVYPYVPKSKREWIRFLNIVASDR